MAHTKPMKTTAITPYVPQIMSTIKFSEIKERHTIRDHTDPNRIVKGDNYFHHLPSKFNYTYNGFVDEKHICLVDPKTGKNVKVDEKQFLKEFKLSGLNRKKTK